MSRLKDTQKRRKSSPSPLLLVGILLLLVLAIPNLTQLAQTDIALSSNEKARDAVDCEPSVVYQPDPTSSNQPASATTDSAKDPGDIVPISCQAVIAHRQNATYAATDPNENLHYARYTKTDPPFFISLHKQAFDRTRWAIWDYGFYYEQKLAKAFVQVLRDTEGPTRVLDVGGNIGYFSLLSAATKKDLIIDTFEPNDKNRLRYCESRGLNYWQRGEFDGTSGGSGPLMNVYEYGVGEAEGSFTFLEHQSNPGQGALAEAGKAANTHNTRAYSIRVITLDALAKARGWFDNPEDIAILKIDVEGLEYKVIEGAKEMLQAKLVRHIFTEVSARNKKEGDQNIPFIQQMIAAGYRLYQIGGWQGPSKPVTWAHDDTLSQQILNATQQESSHQLNLWWTVDPRYTN